MMVKAKAGQYLTREPSKICKSHKVCTKDGSKFVVHNSNFQLLNQPDFANIPKTPLN